jgi:iron(III) transport system substrate-binding protein
MSMLFSQYSFSGDINPQPHRKEDQVMKKLFGTILIFLVTVAFPLSAIAQELNLYGSAEPRVIEFLATQFEKQTGTKANWIRMSSGETLARIRAEKNNPQADVWWGGTLDPHSAGALEGLTEPYEPSLFNEIDSRFRDPIGGNQVIGVYVGILGLSVNEGILKDMGLPMPRGWKDLVDPRYKGLIGVANPNTSGTALTTLATQVFLWGEDEGIEYMKKLHKNIANYTKSGVAPGVLAGRGEIAIAIIFLHDAVYHATQGYPITPIVPVEGTGYEIGGLNLVKGAPHPQVARRFIDWVVSAKVQEGLASVGSFQLPTNTRAKVPKESIPIESVKIVDYDFKWVAKNGRRIQDRWTREVFTLPR